MASAHEDFEKGLGAEKIEYGSESKADASHSDDFPKDTSLAAVSPTRTFEAPEFIRNWSPEERLAIENRLRRKIDLRLMPMIILSTFLWEEDLSPIVWSESTYMKTHLTFWLLVYIMNYLDRV
jgi:hypothetical protein